MFSEPTIREFISRFPNLTEAEVRKAVAWVDDRTFSNPNAVLESMLRKQSEASQAQPIRTGKPVREHRGTLREDGSWWSEADTMSQTEAQIREVIAAIIRLRLSPAESVDLCLASPARDCFKPGPWFEHGTLTDQPGGAIRVWTELTAKPVPDTTGGPYREPDWLVAAWRNAYSANAAQEMVRVAVYRHWQQEQSLARAH